MTDRPSPDELLRRAEAEQARASRGKLTVFLGAAPGVGKTYAMLEVARSEMEREKRDVVVGIVETHGRYETGAQLLGLELLPRRRLHHRGVELQELDLDAALARRPQLLLVDELAHENAEGSRHVKRWQDVEELLAAGIDVLSTMNVQHVESLNDVVARVTGVRVRETVPDSVLDRAHELKLVDLPPDELLERLREGKVYVPAQAQRAIENFFKKGNLIALRELSLRYTAERVDAQMHEYFEAQGLERAWGLTDQLLVAVSPSPHSARLVRAARRMSASLHARWFAVYVERPTARSLPAKMAAQLAKNLQLAEQQGAEVVTLTGDDAPAELLAFARTRKITKLVVGKPVVRSLMDRFRPSLVDELVRRSGDIDVYVTAGDSADEVAPERDAVREPQRLTGWLAAVLAPLVCTAAGLLLFGRDQLPDLVMIYLLGIMLVAWRFDLSASVLAAFCSVAAFDFVFVPPYLTFAVVDLRHTTTFAVMFLVAVVISSLTQRARNQAASARERELRTAALYALSRDLAAAQDGPSVLNVASAQLERVFASETFVFVPEADGKLRRRHASSSATEPSERELGVAEWVWSNQSEAGLGTTTLPSAGALYLPLTASGRRVGVLSLSPRDPQRFQRPEQRRQLDAFASQMALAMERAALAEETAQARRLVETEQLRSSLLSSVSHDLRTPLAVITGATSALLEASRGIDTATQQELLRTVLDEAERLNRLIRNLLDMTRLESGAVQVKKEWLPLEELVGAALNRIDARLTGREVHVDVPASLPLVACDPVLIEQALFNLLENAVKYGDGPIDIHARASAAELVVEIGDRGPGIGSGEESQLFEKFHRGARAGGRDGVGLGLTICRAIVVAHGGRIWAMNREGGGAAFSFALPRGGEPPELSSSEPEELGV